MRVEHLHVQHAVHAHLHIVRVMQICSAMSMAISFKLWRYATFSTKGIRM